jgi:hypothetical protein
MDGRALTALALAGLVVGHAVTGSRGVIRSARPRPRLTLQQVFEKLATQGWDVGDQHLDDGFVVHTGEPLRDEGDDEIQPERGQSFLIWAEGWGLESLEDQPGRPTMKKLKKLANSYAKEHNGVTFTAGFGEATFVTFSGFELKPEEVVNAIESRDEDTLMELDED